jgi:hypothetical protein
MREEELKNTIAKEYFYLYDCTKIIGNVDFCVCMHQSQKALFDQESLLWAEAKTGSSDIYKSIVQLILTIGKARTFDKFLPPAMLGAFDGEKIAFIPYSEIHDIFYLNDFNWNVTSSNYETKEFKFVHDKVKSIIDNKALLFHFESDEKDITRFIKNNFVVGKFGLTKTRIDKNNFIVVYNKWLNSVKKTIAVNWEIAKKNGLIDGDFYLADLISDENTSLKDNLYVVLKATRYEFHRFVDQFGAFTSSSVEFNDKQVAHTQFWNKYERPPKEEYWDYIIERRDLLVPQDVRERKGSFFTPQIWVELSQKYLTDVLGEDWQDEYYVWDCAAGTGNLLTGLTNKYNIWASTLDEQDVEVMKDRIKNGANLLEDHVFQFDFLNDEFTKLPKPLQEIINNPKKRKKLVIYINPPYAEVSSKAIKGKVGVNLTNTHIKYSNIIGTAGRELFALFLTRIYCEIPNCKIGEFSTLKALNGSAFDKYRNFFKAKFEKGFIVPANTFDNVFGSFPTGFKIWNTENREKFNSIIIDIFDSTGILIGNKLFCSLIKEQFINRWISEYKVEAKLHIGYMDGINGNDFQHNNIVYITNGKDYLPNPRGLWINSNNLLECSIYFTVRHLFEHTWINHNDQFLYPNDRWKSDIEFQNNCLTFSLFHSKNSICSNVSSNHWIPFTEYEVGAREKFESDFMVKFIEGTHKKTSLSEPRIFYGDKRDYTEERTTPLEFSSEAKTVFNAGRELWKYYHAQPNCNVNASLYDIREHFQGRNPAGKMNNKSDDAQYMSLIGDLRDKLKILAKKIEPKVYEYGFLKQ